MVLFISVTGNYNILYLYKANIIEQVLKLEQKRAENRLFTG